MLFLLFLFYRNAVGRGNKHRIRQRGRHEAVKMSEWEGLGGLHREAYEKVKR